MRKNLRQKREEVERKIEDKDLKRYLFKNKNMKAAVDSPSTDRFYGSGIKLYKLRSKEGRYFNTISLIKLFVFEPIFINFQLFPTTQILLIFTIQVVYFCFFMRCAFVSRIFESKVQTAALLLNETAVTLFLAIGLLMNSVDIKDDSTSFNI